MDVGDPGAHRDPAVLNVKEGKNADLGPVPDHGLNMEAGPVQDQPQRASAVTLRTAPVIQNIYIIPYNIQMRLGQT